MGDWAGGYRPLPEGRPLGGGMGTRCDGDTRLIRGTKNGMKGF